MAERPTPFVDLSGVIATGGTAQALAAYDSSRKYLRISNPATATESLFVNDAGGTATTSAPTAANGSLEIVPGQVYAPYPVPCTPISIIAATTNHAFEAKVGQ